MLLLGFATANAANYEPTAFATHYGSFEARVTIPQQNLSNGTHPAWVLSIKMNYKAQYNTSNGKILSVTYRGAEFYPGNTTSPSGLGFATSINYDSVNATISADGYSITFKPYCAITLIYYQNAALGLNAVLVNTPQLTGNSVTVTPNTY